MQSNSGSGIGDTIMAIASVVGIVAVAISNNLAEVNAWLHAAESALQAAEGPGMLGQALIGFAVVAIIGIALRPRGTSEAQSGDSQPTGVGYRHSRSARTASNFKKLTEV